MHKNYTNEKHKTHISLLMFNKTALVGNEVHLTVFLKKGSSKILTHGHCFHFVFNILQYRMWYWGTSIRCMVSKFINYCWGSYMWLCLYISPQKMITIDEGLRLYKPGFHHIQPLFKITLCWKSVLWVIIEIWYSVRRFSSL